MCTYIKTQAQITQLGRSEVFSELAKVEHLIFGVHKTMARLSEIPPEGADIVNGTELEVRRDIASVREYLGDCVEYQRDLLRHIRKTAETGLMRRK